MACRLGLEARPDETLPKGGDRIVSFNLWCPLDGALLSMGWGLPLVPTLLREMPPPRGSRKRVSPEARVEVGHL